MLNLLIYIFTIFGILIIKFILPRILRQIRGNKLPKGAIIVKGNVPINDKRKIGSRLSKIAVSFGIAMIYIIQLDFIIRLMFFGFGEHNLIFIVDLPVMVYWIGIIGMWFLGIWVSITFIYNVNYTACFKQLKEAEYALATGGTYKYVRHPAYIAGIFEIVFIFLGTGVWFIFFGLIGFLALPYQAKEEEEMMRQMFGNVYEDYMFKTGRFLPRILKE